MGGISRRDILKSTATGTFAYFTGLGRDTVKNLFPYVTPPDKTEPGVWTKFATTCRDCPAGCGMHLLCRDGRVVKPEGIPHHPVNMGGLCPRGQSSPQGQYDPDRNVRPYESKLNMRCDWFCAPGRIGKLIAESNGKIFIISDLQTGSQLEFMHDFLRQYDSPGNLLIYEPFDYLYMKNAYGLLFDTPVTPYHDLAGCDVILAVCCDFLETWVSNVQFARQFGNMRSPVKNQISTLIYAGPRLSMTAANADFFYQVPAGYETQLLLSLLSSMAQQNLVRENRDLIARFLEVNPAPAKIPGITAEQIANTARLFAGANKSIALSGQSAGYGTASDELAQVTALLNLAAGNIGKTIDLSRAYASSTVQNRNQFLSKLDAITKDDIVIINSANPVYTLPGCEKQLLKAKTLIYAGTLLDETANISEFVLPMSYWYESWGDYQPYTGLHSVVQPGMTPLNDTKSFPDILITLAQNVKKPLKHKNGSLIKDFHQYIQNYWQNYHDSNQIPGTFADFWESWLRQGYFEEPRKSLSPKLSPKVAELKLNLNPPAQNLQLWAWSSIMFYDGRLANRGWIQENPEPISTVVWDNYADLNPATADKFGLHQNSTIEIASKTGSITCPVRVTTDVAENIVAVRIGQGHTAIGQNAKNKGSNAFALRWQPDAQSMFGTVNIKIAGPDYEPVYLQFTQEQYKRNVVDTVALSKLQKMKPGDGKKLILPLPEGYSPEHDLYGAHPHRGHRWAMVIDINRCIGCNACAVACYAENNVGVLGPDILRNRHGREMAWLKIPAYKIQNSSRLSFLPMLCQHCDAAPCEPVCPVFASVHNEEGLNAQIYNRCIGTRYCSNNCPYKVRRFNWFDAKWPEPLNMQLNPEVTVRSRGVMEKCTFCIQRIRQVERRAIRENRPVRDGEVQPACVQSCPTGVFTFGDLMDPDSKVNRLTREDPRRYHVLEDLNTKPAVTYLQKIINDIA